MATENHTEVLRDVLAHIVTKARSFPDYPEEQLVQEAVNIYFTVSRDRLRFKEQENEC